METGVNSGAGPKNSREKKGSTPADNFQGAHHSYKEVPYMKLT